MEKIIPAFEKSMFDAKLKDAGMDMTKLGIDALLDDGILQSIPIVKLLVGVGKTAQNIHDRNLLKQTINFINTFNSRVISLEKIEKYRCKLFENPSFAEKELGRVIILLNSYIDLSKSKLLAIFYSAYVNEIIVWDKFCELSDVVSRLFISDLTLLREIYCQRITNTDQCEPYQAERLISIGLLDSSVKSLSIGGPGSKLQKHLHVSSLGSLFCSMI